MKTDMFAPIQVQVRVSRITTISTRTGCRSPNLLSPFVFGDGLHFIFGKIPISVKDDS